MITEDVVNETIRCELASKNHLLLGITEEQVRELVPLLASQLNSGIKPRIDGPDKEIGVLWLITVQWRFESLSRDKVEYPNTYSEWKRLNPNG